MNIKTNNFILNWVYNALGEMDIHESSTLTYVHDYINSNIRGLLRDDDRIGVLKNYLSAIFHIYIETLDAQEEWRNNPNDTNGTTKVFYIYRELHLKNLLSVIEDIMTTYSIEIDEVFLDEWRKVTSARGNRLPAEKINRFAKHGTPTAASNELQHSSLPIELDTDRARKYFARAIELGYMERTATGFNWLFGGDRRKARLGYFVVKVYCPNNTEQLPESAINNLFGVNRIASAITQLYNAKKPQKWRADIDKIFTD